jgi:hypothetical protein
VSIERNFCCNGPGCDRRVQTTQDRPPTFLTVRKDMHFCSWDCALRFAESGRVTLSDARVTDAPSAA